VGDTGPGQGPACLDAARAARRLSRPGPAPGVGSPGPAGITPAGTATCRELNSRQLLAASRGLDTASLRRERPQNADRLSLTSAASTVYPWLEPRILGLTATQSPSCPCHQAVSADGTSESPLAALSPSSSVLSPSLSSPIPQRVQI